jgi:hypothetical protein
MMPMKLKPSVCFVAGAGGGAFEWNIWRRVFQAQGYAVYDWEYPALPAAPINDSQAEAIHQQRASTLRDFCLQHTLDLVVAASLGGSLALHACDAHWRPRAMVLIAPLTVGSSRSTFVGTGIKTWAHSNHLANTLSAVPDAHPASNLFAHSHWNDEAVAILRYANAHCLPTPDADSTLLILAADDHAIDNAKVSAQLSNVECWTEANFSHAGLLFGNGAASLALRTAQWCSKKLAQR